MLGDAKVPNAAVEYRLYDLGFQGGNPKGAIDNVENVLLL